MTFNFQLDFISLPSVGSIVISEPVGFDKAGYKVTQDSSRFGRDVVKVCEDTELTFTREFFENLTVTQILPNGQMINHASLGFDFLLDIFQQNGWEGEVNISISNGTTIESLGILDMATAVVEFDMIKFKVIQNTNREIIKRLSDTDIDAFNDEALDGRTITPCATTNILLKAKPIIQSSTWIQTQERFIEAEGVVKPFNQARQITESGIENTLTAFTQESATFISAMNNFKYINAQNDLTSGDLILTPNIEFHYQQSGGSSSSVAGFRLRYGIWTGSTFDLSQEYGTLYEKYLYGTSTQDFVLNTPITIPLNDIQRSYNLSLFWEVVYTSEHLGLTTFNFIQSDLKVTYTSTAIDTVVKGVRLIDLVKHNVKSMADVEVIAPNYDVGGEHYNNFAFNGLLLGQITDKPFNNKFKDLITFARETCSDYQINENSVEILPYADYYKDVEMASFDELPDHTASTKVNKRYSIKTAEFKYKRSSDQRQNNSQNSIDDVHTETQKYLTDKVDGNLKVEIDPIRSAFLIEEARKRAFDNDQTTSLQNDDNLFLLKCVSLSPSAQGGFGAVLLMQETETGHLQILNNNTDGDGINFNWVLLGFNVGSQFFIDSGENVGTWQVWSITSTVLELFPISTAVSFEGEAYIKMRWYFTDVAFTNQTNEGYTVITGVDNPTNYSNLDYHWGRNIKNWHPYLATSTKFKPDGVIKTASFKTNGDLQTRKIGETVNVVDSADIINSSIASQKILNPFIHSVKVYADLDTMTQLVSDIETVKGYVTVNLNDGRTIKGHVKELDYTFVNEELDLELEERFVGDFMEITPSGITYPNYPQKNNLKSFQINNIFVLLFDANDVQLYPPVRFTNVKINGTAYADIVDFSDALQNLIDG